MPLPHEARRVGRHPWTQGREREAEHHARLQPPRASALVPPAGMSGGGASPTLAQRSPIDQMAPIGIALSRSLTPNANPRPNPGAGAAAVPEHSEDTKAKLQVR